MNPTQNEQAFSIIEQALNVGTKAGAYHLKETTFITSALEIVRKALGIQEPVQAPQTEATVQ